MRPHSRRGAAGTLLPPLFALLMLAACEGASTADDTIDEVPRLAVREEVRIGSAQDPDSGFSRVGPIAVDTDGTTYVTEATANEIRVFAPDGRRLRVIGREGEGPGEFRFITALGVLGDTLWVGDSRNRRVTLLDRDGNVRTTIRAPEQALEPGPEWMIRIMGTTYLGSGRLRGDRLAIAVQDRMPDAAVVIPRLVFDTTGAIIDTIGMRRISMAGATNPVTVNGRNLFLPRIAVDTLDVDANGSSVVISRSVATNDDEGTFSVARLNDGDTTFAREYRYRPEPTPSWVLDSMASRFARSYSGSANLEPARLEQAVREHVEIPPFLPPVFIARGAEDGSTWLRRDSDYHATHRWLVLDADGSPRGQLELPANVTVRWSSGDRLWTVVTDEMDVPWLVRYRIATP